MSTRPAPVVLFVYNRPEHTARTLESLAQNELAKQTSLRIFSDAAKGPAGEAAVAQVREYIRGISSKEWFADVRIEIAPSNRGLANSIIAGVTQVMREEGRVIVLEDDLVTAKDFLKFVNAALDHYANNKSVGMISGFLPPIKIPADYKHSVLMVPRSSSMGWATWADRWESVDWEVKDWERFRQSKKERRAFDACGTDRFDRLKRQVESDIDSWSIRFGYSLFRRGLLTVYPACTRLKDIGNDGSGVHAGSARMEVHLAEDQIPFLLSDPPVDPRLVREFYRLYSGPMKTRISRTLKASQLSMLDTALRRLKGKR
jgi:hypothetical protein